MRGLRSFSTLLVPIAAIALVAAQNDWNTPCTAGSCAYESGDGVNTPWSTLMLDGSTSAISDITPAAGWLIIGCTPNTDEPQTVRIVCTSAELGCAELFNDGAPDTIVRLPEICGSGPFARVVSVEFADDQSVPEGITPQEPVRELSFDYDFSTIPAAKGSVSFTLAATTNPRQRTLLSTPVLRRALKPLAGRRALSKTQEADLVAEFISLSRAPTAPASGEAKVMLGDFNEEWSTDFTPVAVHQLFPLFDLVVSCPASPPIPSFNAHITASAQVDVDVSVSVGIVIRGSLIPFEITQLAFTSGLNANAKAVFDVKADVTGRLEQTIPLYTADIPGLNIPGIITLGPTFVVNAKIIGDVDVASHITLTTAWSAPQIELVFPPSQGASNAETKRAESSIDLAVAAGATMTGKVEAHIIPKLEVGLTLLSGIAKAGIFLELDPYATLDFQLKGAGNASTSGAINARANAANVSGCVGLDVGLAIRAGANSRLPPFFDESIAWDLWSGRADVFDKCFEAATGAKRDGRVAERATELVCPSGLLGDLLHVVQQTIE